MTYEIIQITENELSQMDALTVVFGDVFSEKETYTSNRPSAEYIRTLLGSDYFIALAALDENKVIGGLVAYELKKFEQNRSEIYIYDLAVNASHRRKGIATALIGVLKKIAAARGAYVIFVQADTGPENKAAIELYSKLGVREEVLHFDIAVEKEHGVT